jgi:PAS domain S-box-containing protein
VATFVALLGALILWEYVDGWDLGLDSWLFPLSVKEFAVTLPARPSVTSSASLIACSLALVGMDAKSNRLWRVAEKLALAVAFVMLVRLISFLFGESGVSAPYWTILGLPVLTPLAPKTASCFLALALGILFARPQRGLVGLYLSPGPGGKLARWMLPLAILFPVLFGSLGLVAIRAGLKGEDYPLGLVVGFMIVLLLLVISLNARTIRKVDRERNQALTTLAERGRLLGAVFDNAGAGLALVDTKGRPIVANKTLQNMLGYSAQELANLPFHEFTHPDDVAVHKQLFEDLIAGKRDSYRIEIRYVRKDRSHFWAQLSTSVARNPDKRARLIIGLMEDITERKEAEEALGRFKAILDATPDFVGMADAQTRALYVNRAGREMTGVGDDISGLFIPDFHPTESATRLLREAVPAAEKEGVWTGESELLGSTGDRIPVSQVLLAHRPMSGDVSYYSTIMRDITEHKQFEDGGQFLLEASRAFSGSLETDEVLRSITDLTVPSRADICVVNLIAEGGSVERVAVAHADPAHAQIAHELRLHTVGKEPDPVIQEVIRQGEAVLIREVTDEWLAKLTGGSRHLDLLTQVGVHSMILTPMRGRDRVIGVLSLGAARPRRRFGYYEFALAKGVSGRAALALDNARLFQQSREATRLRDEVLRVVAHDLRNPLNTIALSSDLLNEQLPRERQTDWAKTLGIISRSVTYADRLIEDLLDVARMQVGKLSLEPQPTDARALLSEAIEQQKPMAAQRDIQLRTEVSEPLRAISGDRHRLLQVLSNLISNAIKFSPNGSTVSIHACHEADAFRVSIRDQGRGLTEKELPHLFDPFWQARKGMGGAGLGLAIAKGIVEAHGGQISVKSSPGAGSTFIFTLPLAKESEDSGTSMAAD